MSSILGCVAAVMAIVSPSHPRPAVIHRTSISAMEGGVRDVSSRMVVGLPTRSLLRLAMRRGTGHGSRSLQVCILQNSQQGENRKPDSGPCHDPTCQKDVTRRPKSQVFLPPLYLATTLAASRASLVNMQRYCKRARLFPGRLP